MSRILLIETATEVCSAAIAVNGAVVALEEVANTQSHASLLTLQIEACTRKAGLPLSSLDAVAVSSGPGSYTGLRVGASVAKGICYALNKPLIAVDTLLSLAHASRKQELTRFPGSQAVYVPAIDARRQEIWTAVYDQNLGILKPAQPLILENNLFEIMIIEAGGNRAVVSGNGLNKIRSGMNPENTVFFSDILCSALNLADISTEKLQNTDFQDVAYFEPFYMKMPNITTPNNIAF